MSSTNSESYDKILKELVAHKKIITELKQGNETLLELLQNIYQLTEDSNKKYDLMWLNVGINKPKQEEVEKPKKPKKPKKETDKKVTKKETEAKKPIGEISNIFSYFKTRWCEDPSQFDDILEEKQADALFIEKAEELSSKKGLSLQKKKADLVYKSLTSEQRKKIRKRMDTERDEASVDKEEDITPESD